jgi:hypothetical protein
MVTLMNRPIPLDPDLPALSELLPPKGAPEVVARAIGRMTGTKPAQNHRVYAMDALRSEALVP